MGLFSNFFGADKSAVLRGLIEEGAFLADVRTPAEYAQVHVDRSVNIPLDKISTQLELFRNKKHIIVFCQSGGRSSKAKSILERNGFTNVTDGGSWTNIKKLVG